ncbi:hypothetical protein [Streptomyces racemochromogenes]|uniref:hypothetical protein n=1 Tax=Streptomyces racemochromogenes TaxID=67353 RepID=UPI0031EAAC1C
MPQNRRLTAQNATILTASVEVQTLTISGRQVTLSLFLQIPERPLISDDGTLNGVPWGRVNYHPDRCEPGVGKEGRRTITVPEHTHLIWQCGEDPFRAKVDVVPEFDEHGMNAKAVYSPAGDIVVAVEVQSYLDAVTAGGEAEYPLEKGWADHKRSIQEADDSMLIVEAPSEALAALTAYAETKRTEHSLTDSREWYREEAEKALAAYEDRKAALDRRIAATGWTLEELLERREQDFRAELARRQRYRDLRATLAELPQLYIAA